MAVAFDAKMTAGNSGDGLDQDASDVLTISSTGITVGGTATLLVAVLSMQSTAAAAPTGLAVTWNGVAMTAGPSTQQGVDPIVTAAIFYLVSPAAGANTLAASWTNKQDVYMSAVSFTGTDTTTGINTTDSTTATGTTSITVTSDTSGATVAVFTVNGATPTVNFTKIYAEAPFGPGGGASYTLGGTSNNHTFTGAGGTIQALAGVHVISGGAAPAADYGGPSSPMFRVRLRQY